MSNLVQSIINAPRSIKGLKPLAYWAFREDVKLTFDGNKVTSVTAGILGVISGVKFFMNAGGEEVVSDNNLNGFKHKFTAVINDGGDVLDAMDDIILFVEANDGTKYVLGAKYGLWKTTQASMANDNLSTTAVEFTSREGMEETAGDYYLLADITGIITTDNYEAISGLQIDTGGVMKLSVDSNKTCYIYAPDKTIITSTNGTIYTTWTGVTGKVILIVPKNTNKLDVSVSSYQGVLKTNLNTYIDCSFNLLLTSILAPKSTRTLYCAGDHLLNNFFAPMSTYVDARSCNLTAKSIGDFLFAAAQNNPTANGIANFSGGTNAGATEIDTYLKVSGLFPNGLGSLIDSNLLSWTITLNH
jgi:hypothetical protein